ncbi:MAG: hypothetical protein WA555_10560 [Candidatus Sulfotelmatobacter sp.]
MSAVGAMQAAGHNKSHGTGSIVPALAKTQGRGTRSSGTGGENPEGWAIPLGGYEVPIMMFRFLQLLMLTMPLLIIVGGCRDSPRQTTISPAARSQDQAKVAPTPAKTLEIIRPASFSAEQLSQNGSEELSVHGTVGQFLLVTVKNVKPTDKAEYSIVVRATGTGSQALKPVREGGMCTNNWLYALPQTGTYYVAFDPKGMKYGLEFDVLGDKNPITDAGIKPEQVSIDLHGFAQKDQLALVPYAQGDACNADDLWAPSHLAVENDRFEFRIMPLEGLKALWGTDESIAHLETALHGGGAIVDAKKLPYPVWKDAANVMTSRQEVLQGDGWRGLRWIAGYAQDGDYPAGLGYMFEGSLGYMFEGISDDNRYFILIRASIANPDLKQDLSEDSKEEINYRLMATRLNKALAAAPPASFQPNLDQLDSVVESLKLQH